MRQRELPLTVYSRLYVNISDSLTPPTLRYRYCYRAALVDLPIRSAEPAVQVLVPRGGREKRMLRRGHPARVYRLSVIATAIIAAFSLVVTAAAPAGASTASAAPAHAKSAATISPKDLITPTTPSDVPYKLPVQLPSTTNSPSVAADAPYTPAVLNLIAQLEPSDPPTEAELANASTLFHGGTNTTCNNVGPTAAPTGTTPSIMAPCWTDAQGVNTFSGPNAEATTGPTTLMNLASSFDRQLGNVWGQTEGTEARELMVTGLFGPQTDIDRLPNLGPTPTTTGEAPCPRRPRLPQIYRPPYEAGFVQAGAAATMCSYQIWQDTSTTLPSSVSSLSGTYPVSPYTASGQNPQTWPLGESHYSCEQPLTLTYALRDLGGS